MSIAALVLAIGVIHRLMFCYTERAVVPRPDWAFQP